MIITLNEETHIQRCIRSAPFVDEVIVLDSGSSDETVSLAHALGAKTFVEPFRGFRAQKERACALAQHDWILSLDADEALSPELKIEIENLIKGDMTFDAYRMPRLSYFLGRWIRHGGWYPDYQTRFFQKSKSQWVGGHVHEHVQANQVGQLHGPLHHFVFRDIGHQVQTNNFYSTKGARDLFDRKQRFSFLRLVFKPISKFFETYLIKRGFQDGMPGFLISVSAAYSMFLKYAKLWELHESGGFATLTDDNPKRPTRGE